MSTLSQDLSTWRESHQSGANHVGLTNILNIDGALYDIQDPAVEYLASQIETRLSNIETSTIRNSELTKPQDAGQFATSVTQGTDGQIAVTYGNVAASDVSFANSGTGYDATTVQAALVEALTKAMALKGTASDASSAETIAAAKKYADELVANLAGEDWSQNAKKVQEIIAEIENSENANGWTTAIDKLAGMTYDDNGSTVTATSVADYVTHKIAETSGAINQTIEENELVTAAALNDLNTNKADKADYTTATVNNWTTSYSNGELSWTNNPITVYVPTTNGAQGAQGSQGVQG